MKPSIRRPRKLGFAILNPAYDTIADYQATLVLADALDTPVGIWQTIDDNTNQPKALIQMTQGDDETLCGKVVKGLNLSDSPERRCTKCGDVRKDQEILGMTIIRNMKRDSDGWEGGHILDPYSGNE